MEAEVCGACPLRARARPARAYGKVLKVARTIADLEGASRLTSAHVAEAIQGRILDRHGRG